MSLEFEQRTTDLLCSVHLQDGGGLLIYFLIEHQSTVDANMPLRFAGYAMRALESHARSYPAEPLPPLIPILLHHSRSGWTAARSLEGMCGLPQATLELVRPYLLQLSFLIEDVSAEHGGALRQRAGLTHFVRLTLFVLARARESDDMEEELVEWADELDALAEQEHGETDTVVILRYIAEVGRIDLDHLRARFQGRPTERAIMSTARQLIEQGEERGLAKGRAEGRAQGRAEGQAMVLVRLLTLRFGALTAAQTDRIHAASASEIADMTDRFVTANSLEDVLGS